MKKLEPISGWFKNHPMARLVLLSAMVGVIAGYGAILFNLILNLANQLLMADLVGFVMPQPGAEGGAGVITEPARRWLILFLPAFGGLLAGIIVYSLAPEAEGHGTDAMIDAFHRKAGVIRKRIPFIKTIASALTIGSGGSAGREGPIAQVGAGFGSALATWVGSSERERRLLMVAGAGAGIGAVFRAPLGGALFGAEVLYRDIEFESAAVVPSFVASIVSYSIYCGMNGTWGPIFSVPHAEFKHPLELPLYLALGVVCAAAGMLYIKVFYGVRDSIFRRIRIPRHLKPALGGLVVGVIGFYMPQVLGLGYGWVQEAIQGKLSVQLLLGAALLKIMATGFTISSGGSGGIFAPSMVIGGLLGTAIGMLFHQWFPGVVTEPFTFTLVGMAGFFAGVAKTPISSLIMVSEMTSGYGLLAPLMLTTAVCYLLIPKRLSMYENQVASRIDSPAHQGDFAVDVLEHIKVREALPKDARLTVFQRESRLSEILKEVVSSRQKVFPVLNHDGTLYGVIDLDDIRIFFTENSFPPGSVIAQDLLAPLKTVVSLEEDLASALKKFHETMYEELPVVETNGSSKVIGVIRHRDLISAYHDRMYQARKS